MASSLNLCVSQCGWCVDLTDVGAVTEDKQGDDSQQGVLGPMDATTANTTEPHHTTHTESNQSSVVSSLPLLPPRSHVESSLVQFLSQGPLDVEPKPVGLVGYGRQTEPYCRIERLRAALPKLHSHTQLTPRTRVGRAHSP